MSIEKVTYNLRGGGKQTVEYDTEAPCWSCGLPVVAASMGGTVLCPWCDCGNKRDGTKYTLDETLALGANWRRSEAAGKWDGPATPEEIQANRDRWFLRV